MAKKIGFWKRLAMVFSEKKAQELRNEGETVAMKFYTGELEKMQSNFESFVGRIRVTEPEGYIDTDPWETRPIRKAILDARNLHMISSMVPMEHVLEEDVIRNFAHQNMMFAVNNRVTASNPEIVNVCIESMQREAEREIGKYLLENGYASYSLNKDRIEPSLLILNVKLNLLNRQK